MNNSDDLRKSAILDLQTWIDATTSAIFYVIREHTGVDEVDRTIWSRQHSREFLYKLMVDSLNSAMAWCKLRTSLSGDFLNETLGKYFQDNEVPHLMDEVIQMIDRIEIHITGEITERVSLNPWRIWHIQLLGEYVILERDEDYRIQIFNEKVAEGKWSL